MQIILDLESPKLAQEIKSIADMINAKDAGEEPAKEPAKKKTSKKKASKKKAVEKEEEDFDLGLEAGEAEDDLLSEDSEEGEAITQETLIEAFREFAGKHGRKKAAGVLKKLKVKSVMDIPEEKYEKVIEFLNK